MIQEPKLNRQICRNVEPQNELSEQVDSLPYFLFLISLSLLIH